MMGNNGGAALYQGSNEMSDFERQSGRGVVGNHRQGLPSRQYSGL